MVNLLPNIPISLNTSDNNFSLELYEPCLKWATTYDRGVGYFSSGWITINAKGMADFASRGGKARWITSPILSESDYLAMSGDLDNSEIADFFRDIISRNIDELVIQLEENTLNALAWMIYDGIIEFRFAVPKMHLLDGDFHDKFGIFSDGENALSFSGSVNDSIKGTVNYESIKVFKSWTGMIEYVNSDKSRFKKLWWNKDKNLSIFTLSDALKEKIFKLKKSPRPYTYEKKDEQPNKWIHQDKALEIFLKEKHGILEMATGTGKTKTAIKIIAKLFEIAAIKRVIITMHGNDLLEQWCREIYKNTESLRVYKYFAGNKEFTRFLLNPDRAVLVVSRDAEYLNDMITKTNNMIKNNHNETMFVFDEVHGFGSYTMRRTLSGKIQPFKYRLGLSATPEREFDQEGNLFVQDEVGKIIFSFTLKDAIEKGILCEFDYIPLEYELSDEEKKKKRDIIARYSAKRKNNENFSDDEMYRELALVNKTSYSKLPLFKNLIRQRPELLERSIIFVQTRDYGIEVQNILIKYCHEYHTYYSGDDSSNLLKFSRGELDCLLTCQKISEGIDIQSVKNIIIFASDRAKLVTTQRIGRSLRIDPNDPDKRARVVDYICVNPGADPDETEISADQERCEWLSELSEIRRIDNGTV